MGTKTVTRSSGRSIAAKFKQFLILGVEESEIKKRREVLKKELNEVADTDHVEDPDKGHLIHTLPEPVEVSGKRYTGFMRQRKVTQTFNEDAAEALCEEKGFDADEYTSRYVDQDKIVRLYAQDRISDEEFNSLIENKVTFAFVPAKE